MDNLSLKGRCGAAKTNAAGRVRTRNDPGTSTTLNGSTPIFFFSVWVTNRVLEDSSGVDVYLISRKMSPLLGVVGL